MPRTEIELTEEQARRLDEVAARKGRTVAEVVQESLQDYLAKVSNDREVAKQRALAAIGMYRSDVNDLGLNHDRYFVDDLEEDLRS